MQISFFNTVDLEEGPRRVAEAKAERQEQRILLIMPEGEELTPFEVHKIYEAKFGATPLTSIRRAMTCLTDQGLLRKTDNMKEGGYGMVNHKWVRV